MQAGEDNGIDSHANSQDDSKRSAGEWLSEEGKKATHSGW